MRAAFRAAFLGGAFLEGAGFAGAFLAEARREAGFFAAARFAPFTARRFASAAKYLAMGAR